MQMRRIPKKKKQLDKLSADRKIKMLNLFSADFSLTSIFLGESTCFLQLPNCSDEGGFPETFFWPILKQTLSVADEQQVTHIHGENLRRREEMWTCLKSWSFIKKSACCSQRLPLAFFSSNVLLPPSSSPNFLCFYSFT